VWTSRTRLELLDDLLHQHGHVLIRFQTRVIHRRVEDTRRRCASPLLVYVLQPYIYIFIRTEIDALLQCTEPHVLVDFAVATERDPPLFVCFADQIKQELVRAFFFDIGVQLFAEQLNYFHRILRLSNKSQV
jgi:hypothetical protein